MIRFLEANGYDVSYTSGIDVGTAAGGALLNNHKCSCRRARRVLVGDAAYERRGGPRQGPEHGVLQWQRGLLEDADGTEHRRHEHGEPDPRLLQGDPLRRPCRPAGAVDVDGHLGGPAVQSAGRRRPAAERTHRAVVRGQFRHHGHPVPGPVRQAPVLAQHGSGAPRRASRTCWTRVGTLGYEWDVDADNGFRPAGLFDLSSTTSTTAEVFTDYGSNVKSPAPPPITCRCIARRAARWSSAPGTVQWSWGLDDTQRRRDPTPTCSRPRSTCSPTWAPSPTHVIGGPGRPPRRPTPPRRRRPSPLPRAEPNVADGRRSRHRAPPATRWRRRRRRRGLHGRGNDLAPGHRHDQLDLQLGRAREPDDAIKTRAVDDSGNIETPSGGTTVNVGCPCSIWG